MHFSHDCMVLTIEHFSHVSLNDRNKNKERHFVKLTTVLSFVTQGHEPPEEQKFLLGIYVKNCWIYLFLVLLVLRNYRVMCDWIECVSNFLKWHIVKCLFVTLYKLM
jgi:hypothetical protein